MFDSLLIANRGEIAVRVMQTAARLGIQTVAVYSDADADALHVRLADRAVRLGPEPVQQSYLDMNAIIAAAKATGVEAVHPGYGLLSENADFARCVRQAGLIWVGPEPEAIESMSDKIRARAMMITAGVPVARGTTAPPSDVSTALAAAEAIRYPLMMKAAAGGGGIGMAAVTSPENLKNSFSQARARAERMFGSGDLLLEQLMCPARHVEVQVLGLSDGRVVALGDRDCSVQRRFQKVVEEAPAPHIDPEVRARMHAAAVAAASAVNYTGVGTVEFLFDPTTREFVFLEMNTRLQVEHPVTELVTGLDLVELQLYVAAGEYVELGPVAQSGHALEFRLNAEDPVKFLPTPGRIETWRHLNKPWFRIDTGYEVGDEVTRWYDPLVAKLCVVGRDREQAFARATAVLNTFETSPLITNLEFLKRVLADPEFIAGTHDTKIVDRLASE